MKEAIDFYLVSGFLGSGKTTFLEKMLQNFEGKKVGVIVNEFGSINIDGITLDSNGIDLVEISNGSIFCSCLKGSFVETLIEFSKKEIDVLLIENSGMADPSNMNSLLGELAGKLGRPFDYKGAICLLDCNSFLKYVKVLAPVQNQVMASNFILLNKIDLVNQETLEEIKRVIKDLNQEAHCIETIYSSVSLEELNRYLCNNQFKGETSNQLWNRPATYSIELEGIVEKTKIVQFVKELSGTVLRGKGLCFTEEGWIQVNLVEDQIQITPFEKGKRDMIRNTKLVAIGKTETPFISLLETLNQKIFNGLLRIYE